MYQRKERALAFVQRYPEFFKQPEEWFIKNWHVVEAFEAEALKLIDRGWKKYSARTIVEVLVHHSAVREVDGEFKIGNDNAPYLARIFVVMHPEYVDFWEYRKDDHQEFLLALEGFEEAEGI